MSICAQLIHQNEKEHIAWIHTEKKLRKISDI